MTWCAAKIMPKPRDACDRQAASSPLALLPRERASKSEFCKMTTWYKSERVAARKSTALDMTHEPGTCNRLRNSLN